MSNDYMYQPTDLEDELFLSEVPFELLQNSIRTQFDDPLEYRKKDYVQSFITKYVFSRDNMLEDDVIMLDIYREKFLSFIENIFYTYLGVGFSNLEDLDEDDQHELIHLTYRFFIKNMKKNFVSIVTNYIDENRETIVGTYEKKKDVTALNFKDEIDDEYDVLVLSNLGILIDDILEELKSGDVDQFLTLCNGDEPILELEYVKHAYDEMELTGNFIESYVNMIDDEFLTEIQSKVRNKILKKYPKRVRKDSDIRVDQNNDDTDNTEVSDDVEQ